MPVVITEARLLRFMPGRSAAQKERAFFAIFSTMIGAIEMARSISDGDARDKILRSAKDILLKSF